MDLCLQIMVITSLQNSLHFLYLFNFFSVSLYLNHLSTGRLNASLLKMCTLFHIVPFNNCSLSLLCVLMCVFFYLFLFFIFSLWFCWRYFSAIMGSCVIAKCIRFFKTTDTWWCYKKLQDIHVNKTYAFFCYSCVGWCYKVLKFSCFWNKTRRLKYVPHLFHWLK